MPRTHNRTSITDVSQILAILFIAFICLAIGRSVRPNRNSSFQCPSRPSTRQE